MIGTPPELTTSEAINGYIYMADEIGQWVLTKDPLYEDKITRVIKKVYNVKSVTPNMLELLSKKFLELANKAK